jgi:hypothetical protein
MPANARRARSAISLRESSDVAEGLCAPARAGRRRAGNEPLEPAQVVQRRADVASAAQLLDELENALGDRDLPPARKRLPPDG